MRRCFVLLALLCVTSCGGDPGAARVGPIPTSPTTPAVPAPSPPSTALTGSFELTFEAAGSCADLPAALRSRRFVARFGANGPVGYLYGGRFFGGPMYANWNVVYASGTPESWRIEFHDPPIWEALSDDSYLVLYGGGAGPVTSSSVIVPFWARFEYCADKRDGPYPACEVPVLTCDSQHHQLTVRSR